MTKKKFTKEKLSKLLQDGPVEVTFTKSDETTRVMTCTTCFSLIPADYHPQSDTPENNEICRVFDLEKEAWRSFRVDSVTNVQA